MDTITIRTAAVDDAAALLAIYAPYVEQTAITFEYEVPSLEEFQKARPPVQFEKSASAGEKRAARFVVDFQPARLRRRVDRGERTQVRLAVGRRRLVRRWICCSEISQAPDYAARRVPCISARACGLRP